MKSIREIAEEIAEGVTNQEYHNRKLADRIEKALRDERERCAKIAEARAKESGRMALAPLLDDETVARFRSQSAVCHELMAAIRKED